MADRSVTLQEIRRAIEQSGAKWQAEESELFRLPLDAQRRRLGVPAPPGGYDAVMRQAQASTGAVAAPGVPPNYDLRNVNGKNFVTPVRDQGDCGSCVAFGTCATIESLAQVQHNNPSLNIDLSEAHLFFCLGKAAGATCSSGWWPDQAFAAAANPGICDEKCFPYNPSNSDCDSHLCADWRKRVTKVVGNRPVSAAEMKVHISTKGPVASCFVVYSDFFAYKSGIYKHVSGAQVGGHCVAVVGYDDSVGCWIAKNSWRTTWGEHGFFRIGYGECGIDTWMNITANATT